MFNDTQDIGVALSGEPLDIVTVAYAMPFHQFDAELYVQFDHEASKTLDKDYWRIAHAFRYYIDPTEAGEFRQWVYVPLGFLTDGASVPRPFWWLLPPWGDYGQAAVVHDILCETFTVYDAAFMPVKINRERADKIFREAMKVAGVNWLTRQVMYYGVRLWAKLGGKPNYARLALKRKLEAEYNVVYQPAEPTPVIP